MSRVLRCRLECQGGGCLIAIETSRLSLRLWQESDKLLAQLYEHITSPEFVYTHSWRPGDLLLWDNASVQHKATFDYDLPLRRLMHRTTVRGTAPF